MKMRFLFRVSGLTLYDGDEPDNPGVTWSKEVDLQKSKDNKLKSAPSIASSGMSL